ncbi:MAG: hypothetical protein MZV70_29155 [Desulfobacterales bacterium]|nr:hypothetical protein [Desulfobacterales bacterium]
MNVQFPVDLWAELKLEGKRRHMPLGEVVAEYVRKAKALEPKQDEISSFPPFTQQPEKNVYWQKPRRKHLF